MAGAECSALDYVTDCGLGQNPANGLPRLLAFEPISLSLSRPSHLSCINWVWCWNPPAAAHAHVQSAAVKTSMFSTTIMIIAAEHSAKRISKSD